MQALRRDYLLRTAFGPRILNVVDIYTILSIVSCLVLSKRWILLIFLNKEHQVVGVWFAGSPKLLRREFLKDLYPMTRRGTKNSTLASSLYMLVHIFEKQIFLTLETGHPTKFVICVVSRVRIYTTVKKSPPLGTRISWSNNFSPQYWP